MKERIEKIRTLLQDRKLRVVAKHCGVSIMTLNKINRGIEFNIKEITVSKIEKYFDIKN